MARYYLFSYIYCQSNHEKKKKEKSKKEKLFVISSSVRSKSFSKSNRTTTVMNDELISTFGPQEILGLLFFFFLP